MAIVKAYPSLNEPLDFDALNFYEATSHATGVFFYDNVNRTFDGRTYSDVLELDWVDGFSYRSIFGGFNVTLDASGNITGGTATGYVVLVWNGSAWTTAWSVRDISVSAVALYQAFNTSSTSDDRTIIQAALAGNDSISGGSFADRLDGFAGNDTVVGGAGNDSLSGGSGNDTLDGGTGNDVMKGGLGNDTYVVGSAGDLVVELANAGTDTVRSSISYTLTDNVERLTLTGTGALNGTGNTLANLLTGNTGSNFLDGKAGADTMKGGLGNDTYVVGSAGDLVVELANAGTDTVRSSISYTLTDNVERLTLTGTGALNGTGNTLANLLTGNTGSNAIDGKAGADTMRGGAGNDTYRVDNAGDQVQEIAGQGTDKVYSSVSYSLAGQYVENLTLTGSANINATGNGLANKLIGNSGNNVLNGGGGTDVMTGGGGLDTFVFSTSLVAGNIDTITDFSVVSDTLRLSSTVFNTIVGTGTLSAAQFAANTSGTARDANDRIIYETDTGKLFFDSNGSATGGAVQFATLAPGLALTNADFSIV